MFRIRLLSKVYWKKKRYCEEYFQGNRDKSININKNEGMNKNMNLNSSLIFDK